ncbi:Phenylalanine aminomutase (L-beta-phenylalanine forming) [Lachnellula suecica]|uniref:Phenylalanine aminomutase (L-beta-phenylalanine forming) n=1 Tax=Lachnellula suecica TaxID=602035 RepID=A0A8T9BWP9_9HELO|nr:Phenylalanine aminomutase (L-beta-phenylalanine forming) [Lachnellula suecica]
MDSHTDLVLREWDCLIGTIKPGSALSLSGDGLKVPQVVAVARYSIRTDITSEALQSLDASSGILAKRLAAGEVIYGVNTGFGGTADVRTKKVIGLQNALIRELHYGILPPEPQDTERRLLQNSLMPQEYDISLDSSNEVTYLPKSWTRAAILIRINSLIKGCSGIRPVIVERLQDLLMHDLVPMIPLRGSISASGDLSPLSYLAGAIQGKTTIRLLSLSGEKLTAAEAFRKLGLKPVSLEAKEGLAIVNGTAVSAAAGALVLHDTHVLAVLAQILTAMSVEALKGTTESFHPFFSETRPHPGQIESASNILAFLENSKLTQVNTGAGASLRQDRYSIRTAPQWIGPVLEDLVLAHQQISIECNSATDNPLITPEGNFLHGGNFQAKAVSSAMEKTRQGIQSIGRMLFAQCTEIINSSMNNGLPPNLVAEDPSTSLIFKGTDLYVASLTSELGFLSNPMNHVMTAEMGNQSLNSLALISARYTNTANEVLSQLMAAHLVTVCQAVDLCALHAGFIEAYKPQFSSVLRDIYDGHVDHNLETLLWSQLLKSFDITVSLDADDRFIVIAKSLRGTFLDNFSPNDPSIFPLASMNKFIDALADSMKKQWCCDRDAYLVHADARPYLGKASKALYTFVRKDLGVPFLSTRELRTPKVDGTDARPYTVGSYNGIVYRAIKNGTMAKVVMDVLREARSQKIVER